MPPASATHDLFLGIDLGTSGCRAIVIDDQGVTVAEQRAELPASRRAEGGVSEQQADAWWRAVSEVVRRLDTGLRRRVRAVSVDGTSSSLLLCDAQGTPCSSALMYDDTRAHAASDQIARVAPPDSPARGAGSALAKLLHLLNGPAGRTAAHALHQADWVAGMLSGRFGVSDENNCLKLGYDPRQRCWPGWLDALPLQRSLLPRVVPVGTRIGQVSISTAEQLGLPDDAWVVSGTTDSNAATLAAGIDRIGQAVTSLGSTLVLKVLSERPVVAARFGVYSHRIGERWLVGGASNSGGAVLRRFFSDAELRRLSADIEPHVQSDLNYYPLPARGERFPVCDPDLPPRIEPRPADDVAFLHGLLEGIADIEARGYRRLADLGAPYPDVVYSSGGGAANAVWRQIRQRCLGVPVDLARHTEAAYGTAMLARAAWTTG